MELTVIVPTFNEAPNVPELVRRAGQALEGRSAEILFVDDSTDATPQVITSVARSSSLPVRLIHRTEATGGLGGAVITGIRASAAEHCLVMDGDLQHPPEMLPVILDRLREGVADIVVASRYCGAGGSADGLAGGARRAVSWGATVLARSLFPGRLKACTDPMTGFFGFRRAAVHTDRLRPSGFKILLEILGRHRLDVLEVPFVFGARLAGESKAGVREGERFLRQLVALRFGRLAGFGVVGGVGTVLNLLIMGALVGLGVHYVAAAIVAAEVTIVTNFLMQERLVFHRVRSMAGSIHRRFLRSFVFNNADAVLRLPMLWVLVEALGVNSVAAQAITLLGAFFLRYLYHSRVVYREVVPIPTEVPPRTMGTSSVRPAGSNQPTFRGRLS